MDLGAGTPSPRVAQVHVPEFEPHVPLVQRRRRWRHFGGRADQHGTIAAERAQQAALLSKIRQQQRLPGARHRHVVEPARFVRVKIVSPVAFPAAVQYRDMVKFQPLGAVCRGEQQPMLPAADVSPPLG